MSFKILLLILMAVLLLMPAAIADNNPTVMVTGYHISPDVVMPSDPVSITVTLTNTAQQASRTASSTTGSGSVGSLSESLTTPVNAYIESATLKTKDFQVMSGWYEDIGEIGPGQSVNLTFFLTAPGAQGVYFPEVWIRIRNSGSVKYPVPVNVNSPYALSNLPSFKITRDIPDSVTPGSSFDMGVNITNEGRTKAHYINVIIETPQRSITSLTPDQYFIKELAPGESNHLNLSFTTDKDIPIGILQFPLVVKYQTADNTKSEQTAQIGIKIQGKGEVGVSKYQVSPQQIRLGDSLSLIIRIENTGTDDAKSVRADLDIPFQGIKEAFVGTIKPDNDAPAVFNLKATQSGEIFYTLNVTYEDDFGKHVLSEPLSVSVQQTDGTAIWVLIVGVIIAGGAVLLYRRRISP
ncbi:MAG TPA: S-layer protein [Methanospirillum sp.]|uniref:COG1361 S-layer family protein n=1 Tax=Methanospirillum sp. TaxID=45200 RepID=UPI002CDA3EAD|nr:S-layer protein [Methanospirillum sp.]HWQ63484.1 S-layer protein [Methanospirillum sp.]